MQKSLNNLQLMLQWLLLIPKGEGREKNLKVYPLLWILSKVYLNILVHIIAMDQAKMHHMHYDRYIYTWRHTGSVEGAKSFNEEGFDTARRYWPKFCSTTWIITHNSCTTAEVKMQSAKYFHHSTPQSVWRGMHNWLHNCMVWSFVA